MTPCSIASGLCVGDTNELYYVKPDIARIELLVDFNEAFRLTSCDVCEAITGPSISLLWKQPICRVGFVLVGFEWGRGSTAAKI